MIVPYRRLSPDALSAVIEEYVTRDGTELTDAATKVEQVRDALARGDLVLVYDPDSATTNLVAPDDLAVDPAENVHESDPEGS